MLHWFKKGDDLKSLMQIRHFKDIPQAVKLCNLCYPEQPRSLEYTTYEEKTYPTDRYRERFVLLKEDKLVGS